jgi:hypothetical protein
VLAPFNHTLAERFADEEKEVLVRSLTRPPQLREEDFFL